MKEPSASISIRFPREQWKKINDFVENGESPDFSHAARSLIDAGLWLHEHKNELTDTKKSQQIIEEYNSKLNNDTVFDWLATLSDTKIQGFLMAIELEKEKRIIK